MILSSFLELEFSCHWKLRFVFVAQQTWLEISYNFISDLNGCLKKVHLAGNF